MATANSQQMADAAMNGAARNLTANPAFAQLPRLATPLKRSRSRTEESVTERISGDLARTSVEGIADAAEMDNLRSQKRFLSEVSGPTRWITVQHDVGTCLINTQRSVKSIRRNPCHGLHDTDFEEAPWCFEAEELGFTPRSPWPPT